MQTEAPRRHGEPRAGGVLYTCEHASASLPEGVDARPVAALLQTHWGLDIGAADLTRALADPEDRAILASVSRLWIDLNRAPGDPSMFLATTDDGKVPFNAGLTGGAIEARLARWFRPYHAAIAATIAAARPRVLVSVHSFTPSFRGAARRVEVGVLFDRHDDLALALVDGLRAGGFVAEPNEPYSGKVGLIYSAARHGQASELPYLEIEVRQDLIATPAEATAVARRVRAAMTRAGL